GGARTHRPAGGGGHTRAQRVVGAAPAGAGRLVLVRGARQQPGGREQHPAGRVRNLQRHSTAGGPTAARSSSTCAVGLQQNGTPWRTQILGHLRQFFGDQLAQQRLIGQDRPEFLDGGGQFVPL